MENRQALLGGFLSDKCLDLSSDQKEWKWIGLVITWLIIEKSKPPSACFPWNLETVEKKETQENEEMIEPMQKMGKEAKDILREEEERGSGSAQQLIGPFYKWVCF